MIAHRWLAARLARRRIHTRGRRVNRAQIGHEVRHSLVVLALGSMQALVLFELRDRGLVELGDRPGSWGLAGAAAALLGLIAFNDLWFYAVGRRYGPSRGLNRLV